MNNFSAIILSAGKSRKFGSTDKLLEKINNITLVEHSIKIFEEIDECKQIIIVASLENYDDILNIIFEYKNIEIVLGGENKNKSIINGLKASENNLVMIHEASRPFFSTNLVRRLLMEYNQDFFGVIPGIKINNDLKVVDNQIIIKTLNVDNIYIVQTPQLFNLKELKKELEINQDFENLINFEKTKKLKFISGEIENKKIRIPSDIFKY